MPGIYSFTCYSFIEVSLFALSFQDDYCAQLFQWSVAKRCFCQMKRWFCRNDGCEGWARSAHLFNWCFLCFCLHPQLFLLPFDRYIPGIYPWYIVGLFWDLLCLCARAFGQSVKLETWNFKHETWTYESNIWLDASVGGGSCPDRRREAVWQLYVSANSSTQSAAEAGLFDQIAAD